jgi:prevent-host-death family protein
MTTQIPVRELRNSVSDILRRAESGEEFIVTVQGRAVARLAGIDPRPASIPAEALLAALRRIPLDPTWIRELKDDAAQTTDDLDDPWTG